MNEILHFKVSTGLKNIIGKELINDKYIAIFELVKNSYDASAKKVTIKFENIYGKNSKIIIIDDGSGMNREDIINKWLFVAYSEKRNPSYRDNIKKRRNYAGAKGVGRFSCDRLGSKAKLISKTEEDAKAHWIDVDWDHFEINDKERFESINVIYNYERYDGIDKKGTAIIISDLRENWDRNELLKLKKALTQLVNPVATSNYDNFSIILEVPEEKQKDKEELNERDRVNGVLINYIFKNLDIKTSQISVEIAEDGRYITTILNDRGNELFRLKEKNIYTLKNIQGVVYHMNRAAKYNFTNLMGVEVVNYGSVFVYKNGFRVYNYGEPDQDFFEINKRKAQGFSRFLGTRDIIGQLEIYGDNPGFTETSSRNNGFIKTFQLEELQEFFYECFLKPLEKYVINIMKWGETLHDDILDSKVIQYDDMFLFIKKLKPKIKPEDIISLEYNEDLFDIVDMNMNKSISVEVDALKKIAFESQNSLLIEKAAIVESKTKELEKRANETEQNALKTEMDYLEAHKELKVTKRQIDLLTTRADLTADDAISAMHIINTYADTINSLIDETIEEAMHLDGLKEILPNLHMIRQTCTKIMNAYSLVINTEYNAETGFRNDDLCKFIDSYIKKQWAEKFNIRVINPNESCKMKFNPLEFSIIIDNIISNSDKANASEVCISYKENIDGYLDIYFTDNGKGLDDVNINDVSELFNPGYTKSGGTGIGLHTVKSYVDKMQGKVFVNTKYKNGFEIIVRIKKWI